MLRKSLVLSFLFMAIILSGGMTIAQSAASPPTWTQLPDKDYYHTTTTAVDSADTVYSTSFPLANYNIESWATYPWTVEITSSSASLKAVNYLQGSFYKTTGFANIDTLNSSDSTYATGKRYLADFNNWKLPYYRWMSVNVKGKSGTSYIRYNIYNVKKE